MSSNWFFYWPPVANETISSVCLLQDSGCNRNFRYYQQGNEINFASPRQLETGSHVDVCCGASPVHGQNFGTVIHFVLFTSLFPSHRTRAQPNIGCYFLFANSKSRIVDFMYHSLFCLVMTGLKLQIIYVQWHCLENLVNCESSDE